VTTIYYNIMLRHLVWTRSTVSSEHNEYFFDVILINTNTLLKLTLKYKKQEQY
jgi:hypothetical protein